MFDQHFVDNRAGAIAVANKRCVWPFDVYQFGLVGPLRVDSYSA
jgi:hypothetical protein